MEASSGGVDREAFRELCGRLQIAARDSEAMFEDLDRDGDGHISFTDFSKGFADFVRDVEGVEGANHHVWSTLAQETDRLDKQHREEGQLQWLLRELQGSDQRHLVPHLESAVEELLANLHQLRKEKAQLEESWKREKLEHERHLKRMEEELDSQVKEAEMRLRQKAQAEVEEERKCLQSKMDVEMDNLQTHLAHFEKVYSWLQTQPRDGREERLAEVRCKLDEVALENRKLRMSLRDTQTSIALVSGELLQLRTLYDEKCRELTSEKERNLEVLQEQSHLSRQLDLFQDVNKRLLDSYDALRSSAETSVIRSSTEAGIPRAKSGSIIGDYLDLGLSTPTFRNRFEESDEELDADFGVPLRRTQSGDISLSSVQKRSTDRKSEVSSISVEESLPQSDSGVSTVRSDDDPQLADGPQPQDSRDNHTVHRKGFVDLKKTSSHNSSLDAETFPRRKISDIIKQLGIEDTPSRWSRSWSPSPRKVNNESSSSECSPTRATMAPVPLPRMSKNIQSDSSQNPQARMEDSLEQSCGEFEPTGPAEQTFKVIFVGDAGVGKSSFALRISKGVFVRHMSSTLGVDFLMRTIRVDGRNVAVQLWDTAGQERFRSITKSYFRKADGVMLLYDCTCEQSFLDVRQWVEDVDVACFYLMMAANKTNAGEATKASTQRIPLMIVANKIDLREMALQTGITCINTEQGERLAKDCDTTFMEASAKDGSNVLQALAHLVRSMSAHQELQLSASSLQLCDVRAKKSAGCCAK